MERETANPQKENGYTPIANEIMEALARTRIPGEARQVLDVILRKTYGFSKKGDRIPTSQFMKLTGLARRSVYKARRKLKEMNIIGVSQKGDSFIVNYHLIKNYDNWKVSPKKEPGAQKGTWYLPKRAQSVSQKATLINNKTIIHKQKDNINISNQDKDNINNNIVSGRFNLLWQKYPNKDGRKKAEIHFNASVKTEKDWEDIQTALNNYLLSDRVLKGYVKNGSTWFNNWRDWIDYKETASFKPTNRQMENIVAIKKLEAKNADQLVNRSNIGSVGLISEQNS